LLLVHRYLGARDEEFRQLAVRAILHHCRSDVVIQVTVAPSGPIMSQSPVRVRPSSETVEREIPVSTPPLFIFASNEPSSRLRKLKESANALPVTGCQFPSS
jgi:hypothetical protein